MKKCIRKSFFNICVGIGVSMLILCGCGSKTSMISFESANELLQTAEESEQMLPSTEADEYIVVYICGAVKSPGVFSLPKNSRVKDALEAAGGFSEAAAESSVNLAARLKDEEMICVLTLEEQAEKDEDTQSSPLVDINTADINTLCGLPGIGESRARDIVMYRKENGAFRVKEDIMKVNGIKESLYKKICDLITVK